MANSMSSSQRSMFSRSGGPSIYSGSLSFDSQEPSIARSDSQSTVLARSVAASAIQELLSDEERDNVCEPRVTAKTYYEDYQANRCERLLVDQLLAESETPMVELVGGSHSQSVIGEENATPTRARKRPILEVYSNCNDDCSAEGSIAGRILRSPNSNSTLQSKSRGIGRNDYDSRLLDCYTISKENEARRVAEILELAERGKLSMSFTTRLLKTKAISSRFSYDVLMRHIQNRTGIVKRYGLMCEREHAAIFDRSSDVQCPALHCELYIRKGRSHRFWYSLPSEQISALCREKDTFHELLSGCERAQMAVNINDTSDLLDYYSGSLFKRLYGDLMRRWNPETDIFVFLSISTDGFDVIKERGSHKTSWPLIFVVLNQDVETRFQAGNCLVSAFIPGSHETDSFETFLEPIINDLRRLEKGIRIPCFDKKVRLLRAFVLFVTSDWPAGTKLLGFAGHNARHFCRRCEKSSCRIEGLKVSYCLPTVNGELAEDTRRIGSESICDHYITVECPNPRSHIQLKGIWKNLEGLDRGSKAAKQRYVRSTGVKRKPLLSRLSLDIVQSAPYDPMHLLLMGWVKHLLMLSFGEHPKFKEGILPCPVSEACRAMANNSLTAGGSGIPSSWGRPTLALEFLAEYKGEDLKAFGLFYGSILFSTDTCQRGIAFLWAHTSKILEIAFDPTPSKEHVRLLKVLVAQTHATLAKAFFVDERYSFIYTPTTHAILHLADLIEECGPLVNVSQFVVERFIGETAPMVKSGKKVDAVMLNKHLKLLSLRLLRQSRDERIYGNEEQDDQGENENAELRSLVSLQTNQISSKKQYMRGIGKIVGGKQRELQAVAFLKDQLPIAACGVSLLQIRGFRRAELGKGALRFSVETESEFLRRQQRGQHKTPRQKFCIAGYFLEAGTHETSQNSDLSVKEVYYGTLKELWELSCTYRIPNEQFERRRAFSVAKVDWMYGLRRDSLSGAVFTMQRGPSRRGTLRHVKTTVEGINCIQYVIGYFDRGNRRYILDPLMKRAKESQDVIARGFL